MNNHHNKQPTQQTTSTTKQVTHQTTDSTNNQYNKTSDTSNNQYNKQLAQYKANKTVSMVNNWHNKQSVQKTTGTANSARGAANRLHGQQTGVFSWHTVLKPSDEDWIIPAKPYPELCTKKAVWSGVICV